MVPQMNNPVLRNPFDAREDFGTIQPVEVTSNDKYRPERILDKDGKRFRFDYDTDSWVQDFRDHRFTVDEVNQAPATEADVIPDQEKEIIPRWTPRGLNSFWGRDKEGEPQLTVRFAKKIDGTPDEVTKPNRDEIRTWIATHNKTTYDPNTGKKFPGLRSQKKKAAKKAFVLRREQEHQAYLIKKNDRLATQQTQVIL